MIAELITIAYLLIISLVLFIRFRMPADTTIINAYKLDDYIYIVYQSGNVSRTKDFVTYETWDNTK